MWRARWRRSALAAGLLTLALCALGMAQAFTGLELGETCTLDERVDFDPEYWATHRNDVPLPPYSSPCNAGYDMGRAG